MASDVAREKGEDQIAFCEVELCAVEGNEEADASVVSRRNRVDYGCTDDGWNGPELCASYQCCVQLLIRRITYMHNDAGLLSTLRQRCCSYHNYDCNGALSYVQELGLQNGKSKRGNNEVGEDTKTADNQSRRKLQHDITPDDGILDSFENLIPFVCLVLDTGLVSSHTLNHESLLVLGKALRFHRAVW